MKIKTDNDRLILLCAFRYALGRRTYIPGVVREELERCWNDLKESDRQLICKEIKEAIKEGNAGHKCDIEDWKRLLVLEDL